ncbi:MAG: hypothetical protein ABIZ34_10290, partial [Candidatus Limnocylindrales bacterium]
KRHRAKALDAPVTHLCPAAAGSAHASQEIRTAPGAFLEDLSTFAGVDFRDIGPTTLDGHPATFAAVDSTRCSQAVIGESPA